MDQRQRRDVTDITDFDQFKSPTEELIDDILLKIGKSRDEFLMKCFENCGFSKEYVLSHLNEFYRESAFTDAWEIYYWRGDPIFRIDRFNAFSEVPDISKNDGSSILQSTYHEVAQFSDIKYKKE